MYNKKNILISIAVIFSLPVAYFFKGLSNPNPNLSSLEAAVDTVQYSWEASGFTHLMDAVMKGNPSDVKSLIDSGVSLDAQSMDSDATTIPNKPFHNTALHIAIFNTNFNATNFESYSDIAKMLIDAGANVRIANSSGTTPLHNIMQRIQREGAFDGKRASGREELLKMLVKHGADINAQNDQGYTLVHISVLDNEGQWIKNMQDRYGSIVDFNVEAFPSSCKSLTHLAGTPYEKCGCLTPFQLAGVGAGKCTGNTNIRDYFCAHSAVDTNAGVCKQFMPIKIFGGNERDPMTGLTGLMLAVIWEGTKISKGQNPGDGGHTNFSVDQLLKTANINDKINDHLQNSVLHIALLHQLPDMVRILVGRGADVNLQNAKGDTPLHYVMKLDAIGTPPYDALRRRTDEKILETEKYRVAVADFEKQRQEMALDMRKKVITYLMDKGANINLTNNNGDTLLHLAIKAQAFMLIQFLLDTYNKNVGGPSRLLNIVLPNKNGKTPLALVADLISALLAEQNKLQSQNLSTAEINKRIENTKSLSGLLSSWKPV